MTKMETRTTRITVLPEGQDLFSEMATTVEITNEAAGEFIEVAQFRSDGRQKIQIDPREWPAMKSAIDEMFEHCRGGDDE